MDGCVTHARCYIILENYHAKVNCPTYTYRKRGNPPELINAVAVLRGGKVCTTCKSLEGPELHHVDGNWRNNTLDNLKFYCHLCHNLAHKEMNMSKMQTRWTEAAMIPIRNEIYKLTQNGETRANAYKLLAAKHNTTLNYMRKLCTSGPDKLREDARKYKRSSVRGAATRHVSTSTNTGTTMTAQEAVEFYMFVKRYGITIA